MCLSTISGKPEKSRGEGYKVFGPDDSYHLSFCYFAPEGERRRIRYGHWYEDERGGTLPCSCSIQGDYPVGFHVYPDYPEGCSSCRVRKVSYRGAHTEGKQGGDRVIVARGILIHKKGE